MRVNPGPAQNLDWLYEVRNGRAFSAMTSLTAAAGEAAHIQLLNPAGSGKVIHVYQAFAAPFALGSVRLTLYDTALTTLVGNGVNLNSGGAASVAELRRVSNVAVLGTSFGADYTAAQVSKQLAGDWLAVLGAGEGIVMVDTTAADTLAGTFRWVEV